VEDIQPLARAIFEGVTKKDYFLIAGAVLSLAVIGARWLLAKKWPKVTGTAYGIAIVAVMAGLGALGNAWLADERVASTTTLMGALKVWAAAVFAYVTSKRIMEVKAG